jgi:hypothetical protein
LALSYVNDAIPHLPLASTFVVMTTWIILYLSLGIIAICIHPGLRSNVMQPFRERSGGRAEAAVIFFIVFLIAILLWPIISVTNTLGVSSRKKDFAELKAHLIAKGRKITESDGVLLSYQQLILTKLNKVAKERGETLPKAVVKKVLFFYMNCWLELNESKLGLGLLFLLSDGLKTYRQGGIQALLQLLRDQQQECDLRQSEVAVSTP